MVKIGIYNEPFGASLGGSEYLIAVLAEALADSYDVELVHHREPLRKEQLEEFSGLDLKAITLRYVPHLEHEFGDSHNPWERYRQARNWQSRLSEPYDLFIASVHSIPPFCHARAGVLIVLFPLYIPPYSKENKGGPTQNPLWASFTRRYHQWEWKQRMKSYQIKTAISEFTSAWTQEFWGVDCKVIHPPAGAMPRDGEKANLILSVGRFAIGSEGHGKKQLEMLSAFNAASDAELKDWEYFSVGNLGGSDEHQVYFNKLTQIADSHAHVRANLKRTEVQRLFARAKIFWHAAGLDEDETTHPELSEHFGIVTVEAMTAGCVPVVINKGAQGEIVEHGVSGYLWNTLDELSEYTIRLAHDDALRARMSEAARERSRRFSVDAFQQKFLSLLAPHLNQLT